MVQDRVVGLLMIAFGGLCLALTIGWPAGFGSTSVVLTTHFFPRLVSAGMIVSGIWVFVQASEIMTSSSNWLPKLAFCAAFLGSVAWVCQWDFFVAGTVLGFGTLLHTKVGVAKALFSSIFISGAIYLIFRYAFNLQIPNGLHSALLGA